MSEYGMHRTDASTLLNEFAEHYKISPSDFFLKIENVFISVWFLSFLCYSVRSPYLLEWSDGSQRPSCTQQDKTVHPVKLQWSDKPGQMCQVPTDGTYFTPGHPLMCSLKLGPHSRGCSWPFKRKRKPGETSSSSNKNRRKKLSSYVGVHRAT